MVPISLNRKSLKTRITVTTLTIFVIGIWVLTLYTSRMLQEDLQRLLGEQQFSTATLIAAEINQDLSDRLRALEIVAQRISEAELRNPAAMQAFLEQRPILATLFNAGNYITGGDGKAIASLPVSVSRVGVNYMERDHIAAALKQGKPAISEPVLGKVLHKPVFAMAVPIRSAQGNVVGTLAGVIDLSVPNFLDRISENRYGMTGGYVIADIRHKLFVTATDKRQILRPFPTPGLNPLFDRYIGGYEGYGTVSDTSGLEVLSAARQIPVAGWLIVARMPVEEAFAPIRALQRRMLLASLLLTIMMGGLIWWILKRQLAPMTSAARTLNAFTDAPDSLEALPIVRKDEIGDLVGGFNRLLKVLRERENALKTSEARFRSLSEMSSDFYWESDAEHQITKLDSEITYLAPDEIGWQALRTRLHAHRPFRNLEISSRTPDGSERHVSVSGDPVFDVSGVFTGFRGAGTDITERKRSEQQIRQASEELRRFNETLETRVMERTGQLQETTRELARSNAELEQFAYVASHDLQEPLRAVTGFVRLLEKRIENKLDPETRVFMDHAVNGSLRMRRLIEDILEYSRVGSRGKPPEPVDSAKALEDAINLLHNRISKTGAQVEFSALPTVTVDRTQLTQLFQNFLGNAIKFCKDDAPRVQVEARREQKHWRFTITDNGIGCPPESRERIFGIFQRLHTRDEYEGTGIGLAICKRIVERHGGEIGVDAAPDRGSAFWFTLPA
jgi:signal transduction histidine kinase